MIGTRAKDLLSENRRLKRALEEVSILNEVACEIAGQRDSGKIMETLLRRSIEVLEAEQGVITLVDFTQSSGKEWSTETLIRAIVATSEHEAFRPDNLLLGWMSKNKRAISVTNPRDDPRVSGIKWHSDVESLLCVPLQVQAKLIGVLTLFNKRKQKGFSDDDQRLLSIIAAQSAQVIENQRLLEEERKLVLFNHELQLAADVQSSLLPRSALTLGGYEICGNSFPARIVGGDYFDFIQTGKNRVVVCLGDVTGKGLPAALMMANLQATMRSQCTYNCSPMDCVSRANNLLTKASEPSKLITLFYSVLDLEKHQLHYCNGGHNYPLLFSRSGDVCSLETGGLLLGFKPNCDYSQASCSLEIDDFLVLYSDGITEALNENEEEYGEERLVKLCREARTSSAQEILDSVSQSVTEFSGEVPSSDDRTLVVVKRVS